MIASSRTLAAAATIALLAGCSGGSPNATGSTVPAQSITRQNALHAQSLSTDELRAKTLLVKPGVRALVAHGRPVVNTKVDFVGALFLSDSGTNEVYRMTKAGKMTAVGSGWSEPQGIGVDRKGDIYVADTANSRIVVLNKAGKQVTVLNDPGQYPASVAIAPDGTVGVTNIISTSGGAGSVSFYSAGSANPECTISGLLAEDYFIAVDSKDNFYFDGFASSNGDIIVATAQPCGAAVNTGIPTTDISFPPALNVIPNGQGKKAAEVLWVAEEGGGGGDDLYGYSLPGYTSAGTINLAGGSGPWSVTKNLKYAAAISSAGSGVSIYSWPAGGEPIEPGSGFSEAIGIGFSPTGVI